ncbi:AAEL017122-PA [Aedes aegypti]|uniref:AAEL017122-PA n=1 Tax=Aedes aegypti TaxID=7159 RepID=J9HI58_AEDAE|nr:AAEL017122-PA [Aedes aegypti]
MDLKTYVVLLRYRKISVKICFDKTIERRSTFSN